MPSDREAMERVSDMAVDLDAAHPDVAYIITASKRRVAADLRTVLSLAQRAEKAEAERDEAQAVAIEMSTDLTAAEARVKALEGALEIVREVFAVAVIDPSGAKISLDGLQRIDIALLQKDST